MGHAIPELTDLTFEEEVGASDRPLVVDFWAEWCGPCRMVTPILEELAAEHGERLRVAKLNVDDSPDVTRRYEILSVPTLLVFQEGVPKKRIVGAKGRNQLLQELAEFL